MYCAYYKNKVLRFTENAPHDVETVAGNSVGEMSPANLLQKIGNSNTLWVTGPDPEALYSEFVSHMKIVEAAGGLVVNPQEEVLMIYRNGWWDLPKGHVEEGEAPLEAALREVGEETGLWDINPGEQIAATQHFYDDFGPWEMKRTRWYIMRYYGAGKTVPQHEEGIERVVWLSGEELRRALSRSYSTVQDVAGVWLRRKG